MVSAWFPITSSWNPACYIRGLIHRIGRGVPNVSGCVENLENLHRDLANVNECKSMVIIIAVRRLLIKGISTGTDLTKTYNFETKKRGLKHFSGVKEPRSHPLPTMQRDSHINEITFL